MKSHRLLLVSAVLLSVAGCVSFLTYGRGTSDQPADKTEIALQREIVVRRQLDERLQALQAAHQQMEQERLASRRQHDELVSAHHKALAEIRDLRTEVDQLCKAVSSNVKPQLPTNWHQRLIDANRATYDEIRAVFVGLKEEEFPTVHTWYGDSWRKLTEPYLLNQFPTESQRDQLATLISDIMDAERQRVLAMGEQAVVPVANRQVASPEGLCLGTRWEKLLSDLRSLHYD